MRRWFLIAAALGSAVTIMECQSGGLWPYRPVREDTPGFDAPDARLLDLAPRQDMSMPDLSMPDLSMPDLSMPDLSTPDLSMPDLWMPDLSMPDLWVPDLTVSDLRTRG